MTVEKSNSFVQGDSELRFLDLRDAWLVNYCKRLIEGLIGCFYPLRDQKSNPKIFYSKDQILRGLDLLKNLSDRKVCWKYSFKNL